MLVGRHDEQRTLDALVSAARIGQSGVLVITGEAGIGKTALLDAVGDAATGMRVLRVTGSEAEQNLPFAALTQLLRPTEVDLDGLPAPQAQALGVALALRPGSGVDRFAVGVAALSLLTQASEVQPVALLVDDAHLLDLPSQEILAFVARRLLADAVLLVATVRTGEPCALAGADLPQLRLTGVDADATAELVAARLHRPAGAELLRRVQELSGGNPLAVLELATEPARVLGLWPGAPGPVPATMIDLYGRRAATLDGDAREVLLLAAAAGPDLPLVARACRARGLDVGALAEAERLGLVSILDDQVRFAHPLARSAIYAGASPTERRRLHATVADVVADVDPDRRAWHRAEAALGPDEAVAADLVALGERAAARGAYSVAATAYERAGRLSVADASRASRLLLAAEAAWGAGEGRRAGALLDESLPLLPPSVVSARAQRLRGLIELRSGSVAEAKASLIRAAAVAGRFDPAEALACLAEAIDACFYLADADGALEAAEQAEPLLATAVAGRPAAVARVAAGAARVLAGVGGLDLIRTGVSMLAELEPTPAQLAAEGSWSVIGPLFLRESDAGRDLVRRALDDQRHRAAVGALPHLLFHLARDQAAGEAWVQAEADYTEAMSLAGEFGQTTELAVSAAGLSWLLARQGREAETRRLAADAERLATTYEIPLARLWAGFALGDLALTLGRVAEAVDRYAELDLLLRRLRVRDIDLSPAPELAEALLRTGRSERAAGVAAEYAERAGAKGQPWALARAARLAALLGPDDEVDQRFAAALQLHAATPDRFEEARTRLAYGARLRRIRRRVDSREPLRLALADLSRLGARPWADLAADELEATGTNAPRRGASPTAQLTARELQISLLLAAGQTIRQAAAALFLSPKTVEYHLRHVYTKLDIDSRSQLADRLGTDGPAPVGAPDRDLGSQQVR
jgi:DNA-binding CsgD family transcriptional regulator